MFKRVLSLLLIVACLCSVSVAFTSCGEKDEDDKGPYVTVYYPNTIVDLDPANAYDNESVADLCSLVFETLFTVDSKGKLQNALASGYKITEDEENNEYKMIITLNETQWTDKTPVYAEDVVFAWKRLLDYENNYAAAALLLDIKGARDFNSGNVGPDDIGLTAPSEYEVEIQFEGKIDYEAFLYNLTNVCTAPLREDYADRSGDWAKKSSTMVASGPFKLTKVILAGENSDVKYSDNYYLEKGNYQDGYREGDYMEKSKNYAENTISMLVFERNQYYYRDVDNDNIDKYVKAYKIVVMCGLTDDQVASLYNSGDLYYVGNIPLSLRNTYAAEATVTDALSTFSLYLNENQEINGTKLFANTDVRNALSLVIDREAIAKSVVFAEAATALVPNGVFNADSAKKTFRDAGEDLISTSANKSEAQSLLSKAGITPSDYTFTVTCNANDDVQIAICQAIVDAWNDLGFNVTLNKRGTITNNDWYYVTGSDVTDVLDDLYAEDLRHGNFDVIGLDLCAYSTDAFSYLAQFATQFCGAAVDVYASEEEAAPTHITGYSSEEYDALLDEAFAEKDLTKRAEILHEAEKKLLEDMPVIPVLFNENATLTNTVKKLTTDYYGTTGYKKATVADYFALYEKFEDLTTNGLSALVG